MITSTCSASTINVFFTLNIRSCCNYGYYLRATLLRKSPANVHCKSTHTQKGFDAAVFKKKHFNGLKNKSMLVYVLEQAILNKVRTIYRIPPRNPAAKCSSRLHLQCKRMFACLQVLANYTILTLCVCSNVVREPQGV